MGATDIYSLDLSEQPGQEHSGDGWRRVFDGVILSSMAREKRLEISLAKLQGANLHVLPLLPSPSISISNFHSTHALIRQGYETTRQNLLAWEAGEILPVNA
jgi:hypothetical protein